MQSGLQAIHISVSYMDEPSGVTQEEGDSFFFLHYIIAVVKSINTTSSSMNAILRVPLLLVVQLNLHFMCAT